METAQRAEYNQAVQTPLIAFSDFDLKVCKVEERLLGLPKAYSGTFATTYRLKGATQDWAIRCFNRNVPDLRKRYDTLSNFYARHPLDFLVKAAYLDQGINVGNKWFPVIKMRWAEGQTLWNYIENNIANPSKLAKLAPAFRSIVGEMESLDISHGDLQHGNILVRNDKLYLVDYDSFYLPELANLSATNAGHPHYQHPSRNNNQYDAKMDRFSALVIYLGLLAISNSNKLWHEKYNVGENILFTQDDFRNPNQSILFTKLLTIPQISSLVEKFKKICLNYPLHVPSIEEFIASKIEASDGISSQQTKTIYSNPFPIVNGQSLTDLRKNLGEKVTVIGTVTNYRNAFALNRKPYLFLNFGEYPNQTFTVIFWSEILEILKKNGKEHLDYIGNWISVTGIITQYKNKFQIEIDNPSQIQILSGENEAKRKLSQNIKPVSVDVILPTKLGNLKEGKPKMRYNPSDFDENSWLGGNAYPQRYQNSENQGVQSKNTFDDITLGQKEAKVLNQLYKNSLVTPIPNRLPSPTPPNIPVHNPLTNYPTSYQRQYQQVENKPVEKKPNYAFFIATSVIGICIIGILLWWKANGINNNRLKDNELIFLSGAVIIIMIILYIASFKRD